MSLHTVAETQEFIARCREAGVTEVARLQIINAVAMDPTIGDLVQGSGGVRKRRFATPGSGKSGGWRVMIAYVGPDAPAYLISLLSKRDRGNFSTAEVKAMAQVVAAIKLHWKLRKGGRVVQ